MWNIRWLRNTSAKCLVSFCGENGEKLLFSKRNEKKNWAFQQNRIENKKYQHHLNPKRRDVYKLSSELLTQLLSNVQGIQKWLSKKKNKMPGTIVVHISCFIKKCFPIMKCMFRYVNWSFENGFGLALVIYLLGNTKTFGKIMRRSFTKLLSKIF